jgi:flagellar M-ring protein FliF
MERWSEILIQLQGRAARVPKLSWVAGGAILLSLFAALWLELSGPSYAVLQEGLSPADGGKVIATLQKLGIPYQLQAAGNIILVPAPELARARLQLGEAQVPGSAVGAAWQRLEDAPMTASDLAQSAMATQALQASLAQSIGQMRGISQAQVFLALPPDTPFLADQPKPAASVVIAADASAAQAQGEAIADLVAGAVPGLAAAQVTVETLNGVIVYPHGDAMNTGTQFSTVAQVESGAAARIAGLLIPLVGAGNFQTDVSADLDFTQEHTHQIIYGPAHIVVQESNSRAQHQGANDAAIGIPGALSNEPPAATTASTAPATPGGAAAGAGNQTPAVPQSSSQNTEQSYVTDQSDSEITKPGWVVKSIAVSVVLNQAALGSVTVAQVKTAIAGAFAYQQVRVNVLAAAFQKPAAGSFAAPVLAAAPPLTQAMLQLMAAAALLFGLALPVGRRLAAINLQTVLPPPQRALPVVLPPRDFSDLREQASENIPGVARLLQAWAEDSE